MDSISSSVDQAIQSCKSDLNSANLIDALAPLLPLEKQTRLAADVLNNLKLHLFIINTCYEKNDISALIDFMNLLTKKRGIIKQAVTSMIQKCMEIADLLPFSDTRKIDLVEAMREVADGKIFLEIERARVTRALSAFFESQNEIIRAADLMQELPVETFGSMERRERIDFILEQFRLLLKVNEYTKAQIVSRKISLKVFEESDFEDLHLRYLSLMSELQLFEKDYFNCCKNYIEMGVSKLTSHDDKIDCLKNAAVLAVLAPHINEQSSILHTLHSENLLLENAPSHVQLLGLFLAKELVQWQQIEMISSDLRSSSVFSDPATLSELSDRIKNRVIEHNIRTIAFSFKSIHLQRLSQVLDLPPSLCENYVCEQISNGAIKAKIDRLTGNILLSIPKNHEDLLNDWATKTDSLLSLLIKTNHSISKEEMALKF